jgi:TRAP transporter 4TM/12TM fusion protein
MTVRFAGWGIAAISAAMSLYHLWFTANPPPEAVIFRGTHLLFAAVLVFLTHPWRKGRDAPGPEDILAAALTAAPILYLFATYDDIVNRIAMIDDPTPMQQVMAILCIVTVIEATRRVIGWALPLTAAAFLGHALFVARISPLLLLDQLYLTTDGIFGSTLGVSAGYVVVFVLFGAFMERTGTGQLFMDFAMSLTGHTAGGPGKVAVISSSLFGTISGSAVANVMVDGPITIPLMKRTGFTPHFAAGVESTASTGGQIMPPIMGAAAFVMAEYLAVSYFQVTVWALIPSILYYLAVFAAVHFEAKRAGLVGVPKAECPRLGTVMRERGHLFIPVGIVFAGMLSGYTAPLAALAGTLACFPVAALRATTRGNVTAARVWEALLDGAKSSLSVALACACAGIVIGSITLTGLGITFTQVVLALAQNTLLLALVVTMMAGIVLGMGMPTTPAYIVMVSLLVPALIKLGVVDPAAHMFAFYFAILSAITPPVALAVFAAASLAGADLWKSGLAAVKIGAAGFVVPFMFVYEPALLMIGDWPSVLHAAASASFGCVLLAAGLHGYLVGPASMWQRALLVGGALGLITPGILSDLAGLAAGGVVIAAQLATRRREATVG